VIMEPTTSLVEDGCSFTAYLKARSPVQQST